MCLSQQGVKQDRMTSEDTLYVGTIDWMARALDEIEAENFPRDSDENSDVAVLTRKLDNAYNRIDSLTADNVQCLQRLEQVTLERDILQNAVLRLKDQNTRYCEQNIRTERELHQTIDERARLIAPLQLLEQPASQGESHEGPKNLFVRFKTRLCADFTAGACWRGAKCTFAHSAAERQANLAGLKSQLCRHFLKPGGCPFGSKCWYAHGAADLA